MQDEGALEAAVLVGVRSDEGPPAIVERADLVVDGVEGFTRVLARPGRPVRFRDLLRVSVLLFGGSATALAVVSVVGAADEETNTLVYVAAVWWCVATLAGALARAPACRDAGDRDAAGRGAAGPTRCRSSSRGP